MDSGSGSTTQEVPADLHPRIQERREEILKEKGRRRRRRWLWVVQPVAAVLALVGVAHTPLLDVDRIDVQVGTDGGARTPADEIVAASGIVRGQPLLTLDETGAERRVRELPWVDGADVVRRWPGTVSIEVTERRPAAAVSDGGGAGVLAWADRTGRVLQVGGEVDGGLVTVVGVEEVPAPGDDLPPAARTAVAYAAAAQERIPGMLATISTELEGVVAEGQPGGGAVVRFRDGEDVEEKIVALHTILTTADTSCLATVDLWVPDSPTVTRHAGC